MAKKRSRPRRLVEDTLKDLREAKKTHLFVADELDRSIRIVEAGQVYWVHADPEALNSSATGSTAVDYLVQMRLQAAGLRKKSSDMRPQAINFGSTAVVYGGVTNTVNTHVFQVQAYNPRRINDAIDSQTRNESYAKKFEALDAELGRLYRQVLQIRSRTTSHPEKSILSDVRQLYDHMMRVLAPDKEVRKQPGWHPEDPKKPKTVTRRQRFDFAIQKHVSDDAHRKALAAIVDHALAVHDDLNKLYHTERTVASDKAKTASQAMLDALNLWADALGL